MCSSLNNCSPKRFASFSCCEGLSTHPQLPHIMQAKNFMFLCPSFYRAAPIKQRFALEASPEWWVFSCISLNFFSFLSSFFLFFFCFMSWLDFFSFSQILFLTACVVYMVVSLGMFFCKTISGFVPKGAHRPLGTAAWHLSSRVRHLLGLDCEYPHSSRAPAQLTRFDIRLTTQLSFLRLFFFRSKPQGIFCCYCCCLLVFFALYL